MMKLEKLQQDKVMIIQLVLLDYAYSKDNYKLIVAYLSKQKGLDSDSTAIQQIVFTNAVKTNTMIYYILKQSKETMLEFYKRTTIVL